MAGSDVWERWARRWDGFQEAYVPARDLQLELIADYIALARPRDPLHVLDLCSGPGSAGAALLRKRPDAEVVAADWDPWLLELGRRTTRGGDRIVWVDTDLREQGWVGTLPRREFDAVVATTAMQWFETDEVARIYRDVAGLLAPGGVFLTSDLAPTGAASVRRLAEAAHRQWRARAITARPDEHWASFWRAARAEPAFAELLAERDRRFGPRHPLAGRPLEFHERALREAGLGEVGEVWRHHENAILLAVREPLRR